MKSLIIILSIFLLVSSAQAKYSGGTGEPNDPYQIATAEDLMLLGEIPEDYDKHFIMTADIDLDPNLPGRRIFDKAVIAWDSSFRGVFDGNGHTISNITIRGGSHLGLFGRLKLKYGASISNLGLEAVDVSGTGDYVGGLVGLCNDGSIISSYSTGMVYGGKYVGGLVGFNVGTLNDCYSIVTISGDESVGGLVGCNTIFFASGAVTKCYSEGNVIGTTAVGGLVGNNYFASVMDCYSFSTVSGIEKIGGLVGEISYLGYLVNCYSAGLVSGIESIGGLIGAADVENVIVTSCFWDIETSGQTTSAGGTGITTAEMQIASTFLEAGWDFVEETDNGTEDAWWILERQNYPRLWWQYGRTFSPYPQNGAVNVSQPLILSWLSGGSGLYHDVYFGEDKEAVANATIESPDIYRGRQEPEMTTYYLDTVKLEKTYYWRTDEVNEADPYSPWKGHVWSFTIVNYITVDDFESYDAGDNQIWYAWHDGLGYGMFGAERYYPGNGTGSCVGEIDWIEETIVHSGCQSMPYYYDNNKKGFAKYSEAEKTLSYPRDWTKDGVSELSLWFRGRPADVGSFVESPVGTFTINGSGVDIGGWSDQFHFVFKTLNGPGSIVAKVESIENTHEWAKAGVMIREGLYGYSKHGFVYVTPVNGIAFQVRIERGKTSFTTSQTGITAPLWIKLERDAANNFTAYHSSDGFEWEAIGGMQNIQMDTNVYIGLALTSHDSRIACESKFSNVTMIGVIGAQWTHQDIGMDTNELEPMYVAIANNTAEPVVVYHDDPSAVGINTWTEWVIPLQAFADQGIVLTDVNNIAIGFGDRNNPQPGGQGKMYFDDIRLYRPRSEPRPDSKTSGEFSNDVMYGNIKIK